MVKLSMRHGMSGDSANAYCNFGVILGSVFHRYNEGYRFGKLACELVEKHGFVAVRAKVYVVFSVVAGWTQPVATAIDFARAGFRAAIEREEIWPLVAMVCPYRSCTFTCETTLSMWCGANRRWRWTSPAMLVTTTARPCS